MYKLESKFRAGLRQFGKDKLMHIWTFTNGGKDFKSKTSLTVDLDHQCCFDKGAWRQRKDYFNINSVILRKDASKKKKP